MDIQTVVENAKLGAWDGILRAHPMHPYVQVHMLD
jgi:hypothetical protein